MSTLLLPKQSTSVPNSSNPTNNVNSEELQIAPENKLATPIPSEHPLNAGGEIRETNTNHENVNTTDKENKILKDPEGNKLKWNQDGPEPMAQKYKSNCCSGCKCSNVEIKPKIVSVITGLSMVLGLLVLITSVLCSTSNIINCYDSLTDCSHQKGVNATQLNLLGYGSGLLQIIASAIVICLRKQPEVYVATILSLIVSESLLISTFLMWQTTGGSDFWPMFYFFGLFIVIIAVDCIFCFLSLVLLVSCMWNT